VSGPAHDRDRPGGDIPWQGALLLLFSNIMFTTGMMMTRVLGRVVTTASLSICTAIAFTVLSAVAVAFVWVTPSWEDGPVMATWLVTFLSGWLRYATPLPEVNRKLRVMVGIAYNNKVIVSVGTFP